jgi:hypothetical protein
VGICAGSCPEHIAWLIVSASSTILALAAREQSIDKTLQQLKPRWFMLRDARAGEPMFFATAQGDVF